MSKPSKSEGYITFRKDRQKWEVRYYEYDPSTATNKAKTKLLKTCVTKHETIINKRTKKIVGFMIYTWEGAEPVYLGEDYYIVKGSRSEAYPCEGNVFRGSYEEVK